MKRLFALLIVCAMASAAPAVTALEFFINGYAYEGQDFMYSDIVSIQLIDDRGPSFLVGTLDTSYINVSSSDSYAQHTWYAPPTMGGWSFTPDMGGYTSGGTAMWIGGYLPGDGVIFTHEFHLPEIEASDEIVIDYDINYQFGTFTDQVVLHIFPEPGTIGLLGIGALGLLRRRRKA